MDRATDEPADCPPSRFARGQVTTLPFASGEHKKRARGDRQIQELQAMLRDTVEALLFTTVYPRF